MWTWCQNNGALKDPDGNFVTIGYSGHGPGVNNPAMASEHGIGPIPCGLWDIGAPQDRPTTGPYSLPLTPRPSTETYGRSEFFFHGDLVGHEGEQIASHGCPIAERIYRERVWQSGDHLLNVIPRDEDATIVA